MNVKKKYSYFVRELALDINCKVIDIVKFFFYKNQDIDANSRLTIDQSEEFINYLISQGKKIVFLENIEKQHELIINNINTFNKDIVPIVTVFGHIDNGKTSLVENLTETSIKNTEFNNITQTLRYINFSIQNKPFILIDTPGHELFENMRELAYKITDIFIVIISFKNVISEKIINFIKDLILNNKIFFIVFTFSDQANQKDIFQRYSELSNEGINLSIYGGEIEHISFSNILKQNISEIKEKIMFYSELLILSDTSKEQNKELYIFSSYRQKNNVISEGIIIKGNIKTSDYLIYNNIVIGRIRDIYDVKNNKIKLSSVNNTNYRIIKFTGLSTDVIGLVNCCEKLLNNTEIKKYKSRLNYIYDVKLQYIFVKTSNANEIKTLFKLFENLKCFNIVDIEVGNITIQDIDSLYVYDNVKIILFNIEVTNDIFSYCKKKNIKIESYKSVYEISDSVTNKNKISDQELNDKYLNQAIIKKIFDLREGVIAGCISIGGTITPDMKVHIKRNNQLIAKNLKIISLMNKDKKVDKILKSQEFGIRISNFNTYENGDILIFEL